MPSPLLRSFGYAFRGIRIAWRSQKNFRIHVVAAVLVVCAAFFFRVTAIEWAILLFAIIAVVTLETLNTIIERFIDVLSPRYSAHVEVIKDLTAAAVLIAATGAAIIGILIFGPHLLSLRGIVVE